MKYRLELVKKINGKETPIRRRYFSNEKGLEKRIKTYMELCNHKNKETLQQGLNSTLYLVTLSRTRNSKK